MRVNLFIIICARMGASVGHARGRFFHERVNAHAQDAKQSD